ncbi:TPA: coagulase domain-containing protein [Staphylococcus aureus]
MKKKLITLTIGSLCIAQFLETTNVNAIVSDESNPYASKALDLKYNPNKLLTVEQYEQSLIDLIESLSISNNEKYYEPEYKEAIKRYQQRYLAEDEALLKFFDEEKRLKKNEGNLDSNQILGLTHERYTSVFESLKQNKNDFLRDIEEIKRNYSDLLDFAEDKQSYADQQINNLENQILMLGYTFYKTNKDAVDDLYNKLDLILGYSEKERKTKEVVNKRMLDNKIEDLETIIDEFFEDIGTHRPNNIPILASEKDKELNLKNTVELKSDIEIAKSDISKRSKRSLDKQKYKTVSEEVSEEQKAKYRKEMEEIKAKFLAKAKNNNPVVSIIDDEDDNEDYKQIVISKPTTNSTLPTYTETMTQVQMPTIEREGKKEIIYKKPKKLAGLSGESQNMMTTYHTPVASNVTNNHIIEFEESTGVTSKTTGSLGGISEYNSSHLTEREKRAIKREHVREAQKLVDNYKDTHSYNDRVKAQQKVNTLGEAHKNYFNKQINKVYNGK